MSRLSQGGLIDRGRPLDFTFDGKGYRGFEGDTLASALIANDVRLVGRSFKYHRPRGILTAGSEEPNALVTLRSGAHAEPNTRATTVSLYDGLEASSQNRWPSLAFDVMSVNQLFSPLFVAGFYYKTFMWPAAFWEKLYEPLIRRAAGLGKLSMLPDPDIYDREHGFCDLLVIGGGPAGLAAALTAGRAGARVILADEDASPGGRLLAERHEVNGEGGAAWAARAVEELDALSNVRILSRTTIFGVYDGCEYGAVERVSDHLAAPLPGQPRQRLWKIVAKRAILATGAIERPLVFGGNDRPGVMMASAVSAYVNRFAAAPGKRAVVFTTTDSGWATVRDLVAAGISVAAVVDARPADATLEAVARGLGVEALLGAVVSQCHGGRLDAVTVGTRDGASRRIGCDLLAMAGGWNPAIGIGSNLGARPVWSDAIHSFLLDKAPPGLTAAGAARGVFSLGAALRDGAMAAGGALAALGRTGVLPDFDASYDAAAVAPLWHIASRGKAFVDFQHDVTDADVDLAAREGFVSVEHLKRYTTLGMATDQGKTSQLNGNARLAAATGKSVAEAGTILSRPPYLPVAIGLLAGHHRGRDFRPMRKTAAHRWAAECNATFTDAGQWKRAQWFQRPGEAHWLETVNREVTATRTGVGICDVSTLGKIDLAGPDAGVLLDRLYINMFSTLPVGKARYGVMLREDGLVMDDGTTTRLAEDRYFVTTTTVNAAKVMQHIDYARHVLWPELDVQATSVTEQWATYAVAGPRSRALLQRLLPDLDLSNEGLPYMGAVEFPWSGRTARLFRLSFSGELAYEISVPAGLGEAMIRALFDVGQTFGVTPYGTEALGVMRIEKGHPAGNELNGTTTAADLGVGRMMSTKKDFIGRVMAARPGLIDPDRPALVGLRSADGTSPIRAGAHLIAPGARPVAINDEGHVSSAAFSPTLNMPIALGLLARGRERHGERIVVHDPVRGADVEAEICNPVFVDPEGVRVRG
ncbi:MULTISPECIES: sarcosine oxidase subunit alpha family protein [unclassified Sphingomonas]|uniref:sarcosine oxidase subunit alpha family protein n=1 Tax=unclassified Sphingomonas TaxID=196159 RepID=UPI0006F997A4|nr:MULTISPECIES: sarcosine oxidase subunit alpha family protein [unclassified Sphingomonas]KQX22601.1 sarcosine oxidase subunit alpha [Sphingomonas sp. Root1294]KQY67921.1 sarcosine oxidase subunit alpha [Sphingomonas sp. Root50]KRB88845.1 sarcosine oxidase subunit alpha [Sphingomonas sp. Root720]